MCDCIEKYNQALKERGLMLDLVLIVGKDKLDAKINIHTVLIDKSKSRKIKPITLLPVFCPFCGKEYEEKAKP